MTNAKKKVQAMFADFGAPPSANDVVGNLQIPHTAPVRKIKSEPTTQLNLRVPESIKRRVRVLAARDNLSLSDLVLKAIALYEERHGSAPNI